MPDTGRAARMKLAERINACAEAYQRAVWRSDLTDTDRYWQELQRLRRERERLFDLGYYTPDAP